MNKPLFSCVVIGRNEAKTLPRLLGSLKEFFARGGEMVYVDTGSTDGTAKVARDGGATVYEEGDRFRYVVDDDVAQKINAKFVVPPDPEIIHGGDSFFAFDEARNYAKSKASNDFICTPDCDEAWTTLHIDRINELITQGYEKFMVDFVFAHNPDGTPAVAFCADTRFYDRRKVEWKGIIHETMRHADNLKMCRLAKDVAYLEHYQNKETDRKKYLAGLAWACFLEPGNDRNSHYFARELMYRGHYRSAIQEFERHVAMNQWLDERAQSIIYIGCCHEALGDNDKALECWSRAYSACGTRREPFIHLAQYWRRHDSPVRVAAYAAAALQIPNNGFYGNRVANYSDEPHALMYWAKGWMADIPAAKQHILKCLEYHPDDPTYLRDLVYYFAKPKVSIVIPTIRPEKIEKLSGIIGENAGYDNYEIVVEMDDDANPQGAPKVFKRGVEKSTGELVMFLGDDTIPQKNFLIHAVNAMRRQFPDMDGLIALNDMVNKGDICSHWLASKKLLPALGGEFFHTGYDHLWCDDELMGRAKKLGKYYWSETAKVKHDHPLVNDGPMDKHYRRVFSPEAVAKGRALLEKRAAEFGFEIRPFGKPKTIRFREGRTINRIALPITRACNRNCPECSAREADKNWDRKNPHVPVEELKWAGKTLGPIGTIEMTGGEPSLHPDFAEISENIHDWFDCRDIMVLTNGWLFNDPDKLPLLLNYDRVYVSHYNQRFADRYGTPTNTDVHDRIRDYLKDKKTKFWSQLMEYHNPIGRPPYRGVPVCGYDRGDSVGYGAGRIYGCCTAYWLSDRGKSIPLTEDWRAHLNEIELPCPSCFLTGGCDE